MKIQLKQGSLGKGFHMGLPLGHRNSESPYRTILVSWTVSAWLLVCRRSRPCLRCVSPWCGKVRPLEGVEKKISKAPTWVLLNAWCRPENSLFENVFPDDLETYSSHVKKSNKAIWRWFSNKTKVQGHQQKLHWRF